MDLYRLGTPELVSLPQFLRAFRVQFGDPALTENARTNLNQLKQGLMTIKEYSLEIQTIAAKLPDLPKSLLVDYYHDGLKMDIMGKATEHANLQSLVGWI